MTMTHSRWSSGAASKPLSQPSRREIEWDDEAATIESVDVPSRRGGREKHKSVRFAAASETSFETIPIDFDDHATVGCVIREFEKEDRNLLSSLFWTRDELYETFQDEKKNLADAEVAYREALQTAYQQSSEATSSDASIDLNLHKTSLGSEVRGLELEVFPSVKRLTQTHRRAVLLLQDKLRTESDCDLRDTFCWELLRTASRRYSRPSRLVATKLGKNDSLVLDSLIPRKEEAESDTSWTTLETMDDAPHLL